MDIEEQVARIMFDDEFTVPENWTWGAIKINAPRSSIKYEKLADQIIPLVRADVQRELMEGVSRRQFLQLPMSMRRIILKAQAEEQAVSAKFKEGE